MSGFSKFKERIEDHLGKYKKDYLHIVEKGIYKYKGKIYKYDHILPKDKKDLNILEKYRDQFVRSEYRKDISLHSLFHNLKSSQAMCINFFYPLINEKLLEIILSILEIEGELIYLPEFVGFEKESQIEKSHNRKTNFDFYIKLASQTELFFEIKYTEKGFGTATKNDEH
jgi:hypothetical protein